MINGNGGAEAAAVQAPINRAMVDQLEALLSAAKAGVISDAVVVYSRGQGHVDISFPVGQLGNIMEIHNGLFAAMLRLSNHTFPALFDEAMNMASARHQERSKIQQLRKGIILPGASG